MVVHLHERAVGAALQVGNVIIGRGVATALDGVVIECGVVRQVHRHVGALHTRGEAVVNIGHHLVERVVALDVTTGLVNGHLNAVGGLRLAVDDRGFQHIFITGRMVVVGGTCLELVHEGDRAQVDGVIVTHGQVAACGDGHVVIGQGLLVVIGDVILHTVACDFQRHLGYGNHHVGVGGVHAIEVEGVLTILNAIGGQGVQGVLVHHVDEVAVVVHLLASHKVALEVVQVQIQEVIPAGDDNAGLVGPCHEHVMLAVGGLGKHDVGQGVAVLVLGYLVSVGVVTGGDDLLVHLVAVLIGDHEIDDEGLCYAFTGQVVEGRGPVELHVIDVLGGGGIGLGLEVDEVDTHLGRVVQVVLCKVCCQIAG